MDWYELTGFSCTQEIALPIVGCFLLWCIWFLWESSFISWKRLKWQS